MSTIIVAGYGPGISQAVASKFGEQGFHVALVGRSAERLEAGAAALVAKGVRAAAFPCDLGHADAVRELVKDVRSSLGPIGILHWNAYGAGLAGDLTTAPEGELRTVLDIGVHGLVSAVKGALSDLQATRGAVLVTGGGLSFYDAEVDKMGVEWGAMGLAVSKAAQHKLVGLLHHKLGKLGVYAGEVTVTALVKGTPFDRGTATLEPSTVADAFWKLYQERTATYAVCP